MYESTNRWYGVVGNELNPKPPRFIFDTHEHKYRHLGVLTYYVNVRHWSARRELKEIKNAVFLVRSRFIDSYHDKTIECCDTYKIYENEWIPGRASQYLKLDPEHVLIILLNIADCSELSGDDLKNAPQEILYAPYKVGYLFRAEDIFRKNARMDEIINGAIKDKMPIQFDFNEESPGKQVSYPSYEEIIKKDE